MISLIEAMMPTMRNGSATTSRLPTITRTANSSSTTMKTSSSVSSDASTTSLADWSPPMSVRPAAADTSRIPAATASRTAMPT